MDRGQYLRRLGLVVVLGLVSYICLQAANRSDVDDVSTVAVAYEQELVTPMLSARRAPQTIQAPVVERRLAPRINEIISASPDTSCVLVQVAGRTLEPSSNVTAGLLPASNQKLLTTFGALVAMGEDFRFRTTVVTASSIVDGVLEGDLYLVGAGDPFLSTDDWWTQYEEQNGRFHTRLEDLADAVADAGFVSISGELVGDESLFDELRQGPWEERLIAGKQSGPLSALTVNEGFVTWPATYPGSSRLRSETDNPPLHAVSVFGQLLAERGITVEGTNVGVAPAGSRTIGEVESPSLINVLTHVNSYSSNIGAELLLKRLGWARVGVGSTTVGAEALLDVLAGAGIPLEGVDVADGSGLSETNRVTCQALAAVLTAAGSGSRFAASLAIGAERGSLLNRFRNTAAAGAVFAKTGTLNNATALSGFVRSANADNVWTTFVYMANAEEITANPEVNGLQESFVVALTSYPGEPAISALSPRPAIGR